MKISIVIPTHQRAQGLEDLLRSLCDQDFPREDFEVLVVCSFKDDPSRDIVERFRPSFSSIQWHFTGETGANRARNLGLKKSCGEIVAYFNDDGVVPHSFFLNDLCRAHLEHESASAIGGGYFAPVDANAAEIAYNHTARVWLARRSEEDEKTVNLVGGNVSYKRRHMLENGFSFDESVESGGAETELHVRMVRLGLELVYLDHLKIERRTRLSGLEFLSKGYKQGVARHKRCSVGLKIATSLPPTSVIPSLPFTARFWKKNYDRAFDIGCGLARHREESQSGLWAIKLLWQHIAKTSKRYFYRWRFAPPQRRIVTSPPLQRFYVLPVSDRCLHSCNYCEALGCRNVSQESLEVELTRAKTYGFSEVLLPCNSTFLPDFPRVLSKIENAGLEPALMVNGDSNAQIDLEKIKRLGKRIGIHLLLAPTSPYLNEITRWLQKRTEGYTATYFHRSHAQGLKTLSRLTPDLANRTHYLFSDQTPVERIHRFLTAVAKFTRSKYLMHLRWSAGFWPVGRQADVHQAFPLIECSWSSGTPSNDVEFSVIIPTYESAAQVVKVLRSLCAQTLNPSRFEVLVMDDGSLDGTRELLERERTYPFHLRYFYWPRSESSSTPIFRAGLIRNLGVSHARGEYLCFLDSDILVPPNYLSELEHRFDQYDVVQARREMLSLQASRSVSSFREFEKHETYREDSYWESFKTLESWSKAPHFWKYTCTYALSMRKDLFRKAGWFSPDFSTYGYEDVDLGYRLYKLGARFHLNHNSVYHLYPERNQLNYHFDLDLRAQALAQSSRIFFRVRLDPEIYKAIFPSKLGVLLLKLMKPYFFARYQYNKRVAGLFSDYLKEAHAEN